MTTNFTPREICQLASSILDGSAADQDLAQLESILADSAEARQHYYQLIAVHSQLTWVMADRGAEEDVGSQSGPAGGTVGRSGKSIADESPVAVETSPSSPILGFLGSFVDVTATWLTSPKVLATAVVGSLATYFLGLIIWIAINRAYIGQHNPKDLADGPAGAPARIIAAAGCRWQDGSPGANEVAFLPAGTSKLTEGVVELEFDSGAYVSIEGPAEFAPQSGQRVELTQGRLVAYVPARARGFTVVTPTAEVVDLGTEFGVDVDGQGTTDLHVIRGQVDVKPVVKAGVSTQQGQRVIAGEAVRVSAGRKTATRIPLDAARFGDTRAVSARLSRTKSKDAASSPFLKWQPIWLGNLFDDPVEASLAEAMSTDAYGATPEVGDLGIERAKYAGDSLKEIAPQVWFDFANVAWSDVDWGFISNDAWTTREGRALGGILTRGELRADGAKVEEGIGMHANALVTFNLDKICAAGGFERRRFEFIVDRAGLNDDCYGSDQSRVHMLVIVSGADGVQAAMLDGEPATVGLREGKWSITSPVGALLTPNGHFVKFRMSIPVEAKYLTLVATAPNDRGVVHHAVWSGARLEVGH